LERKNVFTIARRGLEIWLGSRVLVQNKIKENNQKNIHSSRRRKINQMVLLKKEEKASRALLAHTCNPSYLRGRDRKIIVQSHAGRNLRLHLKS
jgi:hypothetical protein